MALNPFQRRREANPASEFQSEPISEAPAWTPSLPADSTPTTDEAAPTTGRTRRGSRGGRGRRRPDSAVSATEPVAAVEEAPAAPSEPRSRSPRRPRTPKPDAPATVEPVVDGAVPGLAALTRTVEQQAAQIAALVQALESRDRAAPPATAASSQRVGIFVDAANVEKAREERRVSIDWRRVLARLTDGRRLVRAVAYAPIHDDPAVSIDTQRFVEPFLDHGYRIVTKPLKRFQGGLIKANLDIEMAVDVLQMADRLDVICLVTGDGDFEPLVAAVQARGVRVEVVAFAHNTAANLRNAADEFIDLGRMRDVAGRPG